MYIMEKIILLFSLPYFRTIFAIFNLIFISFVLMCVICKNAMPFVTNYYMVTEKLQSNLLKSFCA